jgi:hypothetical protein
MRCSPHRNTSEDKRPVRISFCLSPQGTSLKLLDSTSTLYFSSYDLNPRKPSSSLLNCQSIFLFCRLLPISRRHIHLPHRILSRAIAMPPQPRDVWICCQDDSVNTVANTPIHCPACSHKRCSFCSPPGPRRRADAPLNESDAASQALDYPLDKSPPDSLSTKQSFSAKQGCWSDAQNFSLPASPDVSTAPGQGSNLAGPIWTCCQCHYFNNGNTTPACINCGHIPCSYCAR